MRNLVWFVLFFALSGWAKDFRLWFEMQEDRGSRRYVELFVENLSAVDARRIRMDLESPNPALKLDWSGKDSDRMLSFPSLDSKEIRSKRIEILSAPSESLPIRVRVLFSRRSEPSSRIRREDHIKNVDFLTKN